MNIREFENLKWYRNDREPKRICFLQPNAQFWLCLYSNKKLKIVENRQINHCTQNGEYSNNVLVEKILVLYFLLLNCLHSKIRCDAIIFLFLLFSTFFLLHMAFLCFLATMVSSWYCVVKAIVCSFFRSLFVNSFWNEYLF